VAAGGQIAKKRRAMDSLGAPLGGGRR